MNIQEIKTAVEAGKTVHWSNAGYVVTKDSIGQFHITFKQNQSSVGLTNRAGNRLNGQPQDFYIAEAI